MDIKELNEKLNSYDESFFRSLEPVLTKMSEKSQALASNLKDCIVQLQNSDRYLRAYQGEKVSNKESELTGIEFDIFRKYVRLLRSCTIMCGQEVSAQYKPFFLDFFSGERLELAKKVKV
mgnify:CR=1 FL=1|jgi:hypothetical protein